MAAEEKKRVWWLWSLMVEMVANQSQETTAPKTYFLLLGSKSKRQRENVKRREEARVQLIELCFNHFSFFFFDQSFNHFFYGSDFGTMELLWGPTQFIRIISFYVLILQTRMFHLTIFTTV